MLDSDLAILYPVSYTHLGNASSCNEGILSGEAAISVFTCKYNLEIP